MEVRFEGYLLKSYVYFCTMLIKLNGDIFMKQWKKVTATVLAVAGLTSLTGCMGQMATTGLVTKVNLSAVDNRYGREGLFLLLSPVYGIASVVDLFVFNAIEFWTGKNIITGKSPAVVDMPLDSWLKVNDKLDKNLSEVPVQSNNIEVEKAYFEQIDSNTLAMHISYVDGSQKTLRGIKGDNVVDFYLGSEFIAQVPLAELEQYAGVSDI